MGSLPVPRTAPALPHAGAPVRARLCGLLAALALAAGCAAAPPAAGINDPFEAKNREVHDLNRRIDGALGGGPDAERRPVPEPLARPVSNFAANTGLPAAALNNLLQGDLGGAVTNTARFLVNSTIGIAGLFDPAGAIGLVEDETDFGETLHVWGAPEGAYLEVVILGPTTERDLAGRVVDAIIDPFGRLAGPEASAVATAARLADSAIDSRRAGSMAGAAPANGADSYSEARRIYLETRRQDLGVAAATAVPTR